MIEQADADGQIRAFTGNEYTRSLESGDFVACFAWSGDVVQLQYDRPDLQFVIPEEGGISWYDTMVIPKGAPNAFAAADWMNFVYDPVQAAQLTGWVQFISPVKGVREELVKMGGDAAALADSPILFPTRRTPPGSTSIADPARGRIDVAMHRALPGAITQGAEPMAAADTGADRSLALAAARPLRAADPRDAVHVRVLHRPADHAAQDLAVDEARPSAAGLRVLVGVGQLRRPPSTTSASSCCARSSTPASPRVLCLLIAYPIAYFIAFKAGRYRNVLLGLVMVPFFTSFLLRTIAWQSLLNDNGPVLGVIEAIQPRRRSRADRPPRQRAAAEHPGRRHRRADLQLPAVHAAADLRQPGEDRHPPRRCRRRPVLAVRPHVPQGDPAAVAARRVRRHAADVHPGHRRLHQRRAARATRNTSVIGNVVQTQFLERNDYPTAAAISFVLMAIIAPDGARSTPSSSARRTWRERAGPATAMGHVRLYVVTIFGFAYLFIPLITIAVFSFNDPGGPVQHRVERRSRWSTGATRSPPATTPTPSSCRCAWPSSPARSPPCSAR